MPRRDAIFDILDEWQDTGNYEEAYQQIQREYRIYMPSNKRRRKTLREPRGAVRRTGLATDYFTPKPKRKLSAWNKYVKNKRNHITYRNGKLNLKKMAVAFRRKKRR